MAALDHPPPPDTPERAPAPAERLGIFTRLRIAFGRAWEIVRDIGAVLHPPRFSVFMVLAGGALLLANAQGRDLAVGLVGGDFFPNGLAFHACVLLWAFQSWYWSRLMLDVTYGLNREQDSGGVRYPPYAAWLLRHTPHVIALAAYFVAGIALLLAGAWWHLAALAAVGTGFYWLLARRLAFTDRLHKMFGPAARRLLGDPDQPVWRLRDLPPFSKMVLWGSFVLAAVSTALVLADPVAFGWTLGAAAVPFLGFAMIVPVGSLLVYWSRLGGASAGSLGFKSYPVLTTLVIWALIVGAFIDNHAVRLTPPLPAGSPGPGARIALAAATERWHAAAAKAAGTQAPPLVIVATAGGGLRAAYWTATVLGRLQDEVPGFRAYLFGVSGVSGGSLGAAVFATLLADGAPPPGGSCGTRRAFECAGQAMLAHDFLGPTAASLLFPDPDAALHPRADLPRGSGRGARAGLGTRLGERWPPAGRVDAPQLQRAVAWRRALPRALSQRHTRRVGEADHHEQSEDRRRRVPGRLRFLRARIGRRPAQHRRRQQRAVPVRRPRGDAAFGRREPRPHRRRRLLRELRRAHRAGGAERGAGRARTQRQERLPGPHPDQQRPEGPGRRPRCRPGRRPGAAPPEPDRERAPQPAARAAAHPRRARHPSLQGLHARGAARAAARTFVCATSRACPHRRSAGCSRSPRSS